ncbi:MAG: cell wall hydrolase [Halarsenatibacteraceae bacterium]
MAKLKIKYISCLLILILSLTLFFGFGMFFSESVQADGLAKSDLIKGAGVAVTLIVLSQLFLGSRDQTESKEIEIKRDSPRDDYDLMEEGIDRQDISIDIDDKELEMLVRIISGEARGESLEGQIAVAAVVINRVLSDDFPDTIEEVIFQEGQFIAIDDGYYDMEPTERSYKAALRALEGEDPSNGAYYFYNPLKARTLYWLSGREKTAEIGNHVFAK